MRQMSESANLFNKPTGFLAPFLQLLCEIISKYVSSKSALSTSREVTPLQVTMDKNQLALGEGHGDIAIVGRGQGAGPTVQS